MSEDRPSVLIVDDEQNIRAILSSLVEKEGFLARCAEDGDRALEMIVQDLPDILLTDIKMSAMDGMDLLRRAKEIEPDLPVVLITAYAGITGAVEAMKAGAHDYLAKPFENQEVVRVVHRALTERNLKRRLRQLSNRLQEEASLREMMGPSDAVSRLIVQVNRLADSDFSVVITGETGSGKELVARAVHNASARCSGPFVAVDCGAIPETLLESELFGHEKGAFTGAEAQKPGKFELAQNGTLFLDETDNMPPGSQAKLLRVLQDKTIYRVGGTKPVRVNIRLLAASNRDIHSLAESGSFRPDLYYRMNEFSIAIPPLRERKEDIVYLAKRFLDSANVELRKNVKGFSEAALETLFAYPWPGNVRQLRSTIRRAALLADGLITEKHLDLKRVPIPGMTFTPRVEGEPWQDLSLKEILRKSGEAVEREVLKQVLKATGGNKAKAARLLQVDYKTLHTKAKKFGISENGRKWR